MKSSRGRVVPIPTRMSSRRSGDQRARSFDRGFSVVEILVSVVLMGTVIAALMTAVSIGVRASSTSRSAARVETAVVNAADRINRAPKKCDYTIYAQAAVQTEGWPPESVTLVQEYYVPGADSTTAGTWAAGASIAPACLDVASDLLLQRVTITISSPDGRVSRTIQVVKSDV